MGNAIQSHKQFGIGEGKAWALAIFTAIALNLLFFGLMPGLLSQLPREQKSRAITDPVRIDRVLPQEPQKQLPAASRAINPTPRKPARPTPQAVAPDTPRPDIAPLPLELNPALPSTSVALPAPNFKAMPLPSAQSPALPAVAHQGPYGITDLDSEPRKLSGAKPVYPLRAKRMGIEGMVKVRFVLTKEGKIRDVTIVEAEPPGYFEQATITYVEKALRMSVGTRDGKPVDTIIPQTIYFRFEE